MSSKTRRTLNNAIRVLLEEGHAAKWIALRLGVGKDAIYRAAPEFFAKHRRNKAT